MPVCTNCRTSALQRAKRSLGERMRGYVAVFTCSQCGTRIGVRATKHCWRCGTDLDRRGRSQFGDYLAALLVMWPYSCRRCGVRRYRWGKRQGDAALL